MLYSLHLINSDVCPLLLRQLHHTIYPKMRIQKITQNAANAKTHKTLKNRKCHRHCRTEEHAKACYTHKKKKEKKKKLLHLG